MTGKGQMPLDPHIEKTRNAIPGATSFWREQTTKVEKFSAKFDEKKQGFFSLLNLTVKSGEFLVKAFSLHL